MALRAQMRKAAAGPSPETLLSQLSGYNRGETHSVDGGRSEASRILGKGSMWSTANLSVMAVEFKTFIFLIESCQDICYILIYNCCGQMRTV